MPNQKRKRNNFGRVMDLQNLGLKRDYGNSAALEDRLDHINEVLKSEPDETGMGLIEQFYADRFNPTIRQGGTKEQRLVEKMGDELLSSVESRELGKKDGVRVTSTEWFMKKLKKEQDTSTFYADEIHGSFQGSLGDNSDFLQTNAHEAVLVGGNGFKNNTMFYDNTISEEDLARDDWKGELYRDYQKTIETLKQREKDGIGTKRENNMLMGQIKTDMLTIKNSTVPQRTAFTPHTENLHTYDFIDFTDRKTIIVFLSIPEPDLSHNYDLWEAWFTFHELLDDAFFTDEERDIVKMFQEGYNEKEVVKAYSKRAVENIVSEIIRLNEPFDRYDKEQTILAHKKSDQF